jgi:hypothetical protein
MKRRNRAPTRIRNIVIAGGLLILFAFSVGKIQAAVPTIKVPGAYPYEETVRVPVPTFSESSVLPTPAPYAYRESSPSPPSAQDRDSQIAKARRPLTAKAVREAAFKYNGVPDFCEFLAVLPADVSVFDPKLGITRPLVKEGRVIRKNVAWLRKRKEARLKPNDRALVSLEELGARNPGI